MTKFLAFLMVAAAVPALTACQSATPKTYIQMTCHDRAFDAGFCEQDTNFRLFTPAGPQHDGRRW